MKWSSHNPAIHKAHAEAIEQSNRQIVVACRLGCVVSEATTNGHRYAPANGSAVVLVNVKNHPAGTATHFVDVY